MKSFGTFTANEKVTVRLQPGKIHALLGENGAGKSTLVKIIYGALQPNSGTLRWLNAPVEIPNPATARKLGIAMVFQHFSLFEALTVAENIALALDGKFDLRALGKRIASVSEKYGLMVEPTALVSNLSVGEQQRVEIVRCLLQKPRLLVMDEPTAVLTPQESERLFATLRLLADNDCSVLYISHRLEEVMKLCDQASVMRHGKVVADVNPRLENASSLARLMVGAEIHEVRTSFQGRSGSPLLSITDLSIQPVNRYRIALRNVSIKVRSGELVAVAGAAGNGQSELFSILSGERPVTPRETIQINGKSCGTMGINARRLLGAAFIPEDRLGHSAVSNFSLPENILLSRNSVDGNMVRMGFINRSLIQKVSNRVIEKFDVRTSTKNPLASSLSGGNLQKFLVGRELDRAPKILIVNQPTWGVDVGAAALIRQMLTDMTRTNAAVLLISHDLDEIFEIADRITVICRGQVTPTFGINEITREQIGLMMAGASESQITTGEIS